MSLKVLNPVISGKEREPGVFSLPPVLAPGGIFPITPNIGENPQTVIEQRRAEAPMEYRGLNKLIIPHLVMVLGQKVYANPAFCQLSEHAQGYIEDLLNEEVSLPDGGKTTVYRELETNRNTEFVNTISLPDSVYKITAYADPDISSFPVNIIISAEDISELESEQRNELGVISHDLKSPLTVIGGQAQLLIRYFEKSIEETDDEKLKTLLESRKRSVEDIYKSGKRMTRMINILLEEARGNMQLNKQTIDGGEFLLSEVYKPCESYVKILQLEGIELVLPPQSLQLYADEMKLGFVLRTITENSAEQMKTHQAKGKIIIEVISGENATLKGADIRITDRASGIDAEALKTLFNKKRGSKKNGGHGLGLYLAKLIVDAHDGKITVETNNDPEKGPTGTTFIISLPHFLEIPLINRKL